MKRTALSLWAMFAFGTPIYAQQPMPTIRVKTGFNASTMTNDPNSKYKKGFHLGVATEFFLSKDFSIQPELQYSTQGARVANSIQELIGDPKAKIKMKLNYFNIPILAKYYLTDEFNIQVGPQLGIRAKSELEIKTKDLTLKKNMKKEVHTLDVGLSFGLGYDLPFDMFFEARYNLGLTNFNKRGNDTHKHRVLQFSVGYKFQ